MSHQLIHDRHPEFDKYWEEHSKLVYWLSNRIAKKLDIETKSIVGTLVLHLNSVLWAYDPSKSKFTTYFCKFALNFVVKNWLRYESESWSIFIKNESQSKDDILLSEKNYAQHEEEFFLYRIPEEDENDIEAIISFFDSANDCWEFMTRACDKTDKLMLVMYYREDKNLREIGEKFGVTKERVRQRIERAKRSIKQKLKMVSAFADLFENEEANQRQ